MHFFNIQHLFFYYSLIFHSPGQEISVSTTVSVTNPLGSSKPQLGPSLAWCCSGQLKKTRFSKAEEKLCSLIKEWKRESSCLKTTSPQRAESGGLFRGKRQVHHQKLGQRTKISSNSWCMGSPSRPLALAQMALVCCAQLLLCPTLCDHMDRNTPGSSVRGISQARILEQVAVVIQLVSHGLPQQSTNDPLEWSSQHGNEAKVTFGLLQVSSVQVGP